MFRYDSLSNDDTPFLRTADGKPQPYVVGYHRFDRWTNCYEFVIAHQQLQPRGEAIPNEFQDSPVIRTCTAWNWQ